jgi:phosphoribosylformylglycinamidine (FGAM) synthase-like amidotransferase family enzyme
VASDSVNVLLPTGFGINCERETAAAFERAGAQVDTLHLNDLIAEPGRLARARILALAGGFSFGDHLGAGRVLANRLRFKLRDALAAFVADGGLVLGICNGFQTMVCLGLLPGGQPGPQQLTLTDNSHGTFYDGWVTLGADPASPCVFTRGIERLEVPVRHGEGRLAAPPELLARLEQDHLVPVRYLDPETGLATDAFPHNPNGSALHAAGICDPSGRIFGLMPHPEAYLHPENHPAWRRRPAAFGEGDGEGLRIFSNAVAAARE